VSAVIELSRVWGDKLLLANQGVLEQYDAIVIGSGVSGLAMALILAKAGQKVALMERDHDIAPLIRPYYRQGCECSPGLHTIGWMDDHEVVAALLEYLGVADGVEKELNENGFGNVFIGPTKYHFPRGFANVETGLLTYFPESAAAVRNYMRLLQEVNDQTFYFNHQLIPGSIPNRQFGELDHVTLRDCLQKYGAAPQLIDLLGTFNYILMGSQADEVPFRVHAFVAGGYFHSPGFITIKGIKQLLANFKRELTRFGVKLSTNAEVTEIITGNQRDVTGVRTKNGKQYAAPHIITSFHPQLLNATIKSASFRPIYRQRLAEAENTFGLYVAFYKIGDYRGLETENLIYHDHQFGITLGATINQSGTAAILAVFLVDRDKKPPVDPEMRKRRAGEQLEIIEKVIYEKKPDWHGKLVLVDYLKPWSFERYTKTINGSAYSLKQTVKLLGFHHRTPLRGLYLVGQSIYPGFLGSLISSFSLAPELLAEDNFWTRVINQ
jgi:phytoene dehydrogenase-like protein